MSILALFLVLLFLPFVHGTKCLDIELDFSDLQAGEYVKNQLQDFFGVRIYALGTNGTGYTPDHAARIFDTANPGTEGNGDPDLGSPNRKCRGDGKGVGEGGEPGMRDENCDPLGNVLIIQESDKQEPDDNAEGGRISLLFSVPIKIKEISFLDLEESAYVVFYPRVGYPLPYRVLSGDNGLFTLDNFRGMPFLNKVTIAFGGSGALASVRYCVKCIPTILDFNELRRGLYVTDQLEDDYGITVSAKGAGGSGYTPDGAARVFDTAKPGKHPNGDEDLGSPNEGCGGPGVGEGGAPDSWYKNCAPQGKALIIQEADKRFPDDNARGGIIALEFEAPIDLFRVSLLDIEEGAVMTFVLLSGADESLTIPPGLVGNNALYNAYPRKKRVVKLTIDFGGSGAVTELHYCRRVF